MSTRPDEVVAQGQHRYFVMVPAAGEGQEWRVEDMYRRADATDPIYALTDDGKRVKGWMIELACAPVTWIEEDNEGKRRIVIPIQ